MGSFMSWFILKIMRVHIDLISKQNLYITESNLYTIAHIEDFDILMNDYVFNIICGVKIWLTI